MIAQQRRNLRDVGGTAPPSTPLCPTGHLPLKGGDWLFVLLSPIANVEEEGAASKLAQGRPAPIASRLRRGRCRGSPSRNYSRRRPRP
ncbi:MAG: hypothetical protein EOS04_11715 [Mesorhizobium sp.]|nr:MAG: hypothetical protein EOR98_18035 [Mesorhizobium sp.]RWN75560.1 MAG: hypothetical protein EOS02_17660 [Mesorhizobium sp.]RWN77539.1 MAG: hypothetical protein EOS01_17630 [Mesorhizobium sp.]RWN89029.1 MAG: hypothetical protein EOS04_11715 [Mesorhizobium sp.]RWO13046.1 MAG: hypothetical protein EOS15_18590 [Mesorhizobium sp.]